MKRKKSMGIPRLIRRRARGQSIPLIALMIVVIVAMVGLSVDVGNTFAEEREAVAAANAASLAAMNAYLDNPSASNGTIYEAIDTTLRANGVDPNDPNLNIQRLYLDAQGAPIEGAPTIENDGTETPENVAFIQVKVTGRVDTFFARVVNRNDLPINATSYAGICPAGSGVFPLAVKAEYINPQFTEFVNPGPPAPGQEQIFFKPAPSPFDSFTMRRIYLKEQANSPGGFSYLQWIATNSDKPTATGSAPNSSREFEAAMSGFGTLAQGFEEAPWPNGINPRPAVYPEKPGELNGGDWVYGNTGVAVSNDLRNIIQGHIDNQTRLILPIFDINAGQGQNTYYHIIKLGLFVIKDFNHSKKYIDLIFLGEAIQQRSACTATPPPPATETYELWGNVSMQPEYPFHPTEHRPVQYVVVLDVSGSMNMTFDGKGWLNNREAQCTNGPAGEPVTKGCSGEPRYAWPDQTKRRIYVAKKAIELLVKLTNMPGNANYKADLPKDTMAVVWYNDGSPTSWSKTFRSDPAAIISDITNANKQNNDPYKSKGGTNGAAGLYRAGLLLQNAPKTTNELGQTWEYKRVVIFLTDGVSNYSLDKNNSELRGYQSSASTYPSKPQHYCNSLGSAVLENALCQTNEYGGKYNGKNRPISEMVEVSGTSIKYNEAVKAEVYVLALSNIPETGLKDGVATAPSYFYDLKDLVVTNGETNVDRAMRQINNQVKTGICEQRVDPWRTTLPSNHFVSTGGLTYPDVGEVVLKEVSTGTIVKGRIKADTNGKLTYRFTDLARGTYQLSAYLWYKHPLDDPDAAPRMYSQIFANEETVPVITVTVDSGAQDVGFQNVVQKDLALKLFGNVCATNG